jgi:hypothetical protein
MPFLLCPFWGGAEWACGSERAVGKGKISGQRETHPSKRAWSGESFHKELWMFSPARFASETKDERKCEKKRQSGRFPGLKSRKATGS